VAIKDYTFAVGKEGAQQSDPGGPDAHADGGAPNSGGTVDVKKGEVQSMVTRFASQIVDAPGKTS
jgi:hypothetical protein